MIRQEFGIYDENFNDGLLNEEGGIRFGNNTVLDDTLRLNDDFRGGGGTIPIKVIRGCTNPKALNYNPKATQDDGSCIIDNRGLGLPTWGGDSKSVTLNLRTENKKQASVFVDGVKQGPSNVPLVFTEKELLTPKTIYVFSNTRSIEEYRIRSRQILKETPIKPVLPLDFDDDQVVADFEDRIKFRSDIDFFPTTQNKNIFRDKNPILFNIGGFGNSSKIPTIDYDRPTTRPTLGIAPLKPAPQTIKPPITFGDIKFNTFGVIIEKKNKDGTYSPIPLRIEEKDKVGKILKNRFFDLYFTFEGIKNPPPLPIVYSVDVNAELSSEGIIGYRLSDGTEGILKNGEQTLSIAAVGKGKPPRPTKKGVNVELRRLAQQQPPSIQFFGININDYTHSVTYDYKQGLTKKPISGIDAFFKLTPGTNSISVTALKESGTPAPEQPTIRVESKNFKYNIAGDTPLHISYDTKFSEKVIFSLGKVDRVLEPSGLVKLDKSDFPNGVGRYTVYLQPVSKRFGSGDIEKIVINVESRVFLPGPDITHINYPEVIKGADFKEFDVDFEVSWQSINTNYVHIFVDKESEKTFVGKVPASGNIQLNVEELIKTSGLTLNIDRDKTDICLLFIPYNEEGDELTAGKTEKTYITFDKGDLRLRRAGVVGDIKKAFTENLKTEGFRDFISPLLTHYLHIGDGDNKLVGNWGIDKTTFAEEYRDENTNEIKYRNVEKSLVLKLYEPLPRTINTNDKVWISKVASIPLIDQITIIDDVTSLCTPLTPNFTLDVGDDIGYQILDDLITSGSVSSAEVINEFVSSSDFDLSNLNINYISSSTMVSGNLIIPTGDEDYNWKDFVKYSSAEERAENFFYKVKLIESYDTKYDALTSGSAWTGSVSVRNEANKQLVKINDVKKGFDSFEKYLYNTSGSLSYPGAGLNEVSASTDSSVTSWYNGIVDSARSFDETNSSRLSYNLPAHVKNDNNSSEFILFFDMIGQHFDILWAHIKGLSQSKKLEHKFENGITNDLIYHMLESLGWDADMGVQSQFLWEYAFGKHSDGTVVSSMSGKDRQHEVWRRILNNLPYLHKHKGTKRALHAALSCYGIPQSMLTIMEFGGPKDPTLSGNTKFTFEDRTASINISGSSAITVDWKQFSNTLSTDYPNSVEVRLNTEQRRNQEIISGSQWSLHLLRDSGSMAHLELRVSGSGTLYSASTDSGSFFNDEYTHIVVNKETTGGSDVFTVYAKEGFQERIRTDVSGSLTISGVSGWTSGSEIKLGGNTLTASVDEFRLWRTPLSESRVDNHTLFPDAIDGNHISASTHDLIFRNDFEYPKNRYSDTDIRNVAIVTTYCTSSVASGFVDNSTYPYQYTPYDRDVTATVPSTGFSFGNKVRFESQTLESNLSYRTRATRKMFDQAPVDSNKLGLFFSPIKEINLDILKSLGEFSIDDYIGNPADEYSDEYSDLRTLRNYYFDRYSLNIYEYIQLVRYIDKALFGTLESLVPARANVASGLLIEPHILERNKTKWNRPTGENKNYAGAIDVQDDVNFTTSNPQYSASLDAEADINLSSEKITYSSVIDAEQDVNLSGTNPSYSSSIDAESDISLLGEMIVNSGSTMGGIEFVVNAQITGSVQGQYDSTGYQQVGMDPNGLARLGFGLYGSGSHAQRTYIDPAGNILKERVKVYLLKQSYTEDVPQNISVDASQGREFVTQTFYKQTISILPFTGSNGLESSAPSGDDIVSATPLDGYFPSHYRNVGDLTSGLENSFFNGSRQTSATTTDGGSPVQIFTTNPNTLRVNDSGRGSGEPILEVD